MAAQEDSLLSPIRVTAAAADRPENQNPTTLLIAKVSYVVVLRPGGAQGPVLHSAAHSDVA